MTIQQVRLPNGEQPCKRLILLNILVVTGDSVSKGQLLTSIETDKVAT